jgi:surfeit locus 1 family protein
MRKRIRIPGWLAAIAVIAVVGTCVRLGFWQLDRHAERAAYNAAVAVALASPPVELDATLAERIARQPEDGLYKRVRLRGRYVPGAELVWRGRSRGGSPGVHLMAPVVLDGSSLIVLVDRGWIPSADAARIDPEPFRMSGSVVLEGMLQRFAEGSVDGVPAWTAVGADSILTMRRLDAAFLSAHLRDPLFPLYLQQLTGPGTSGPPYPAEMPTLSEGPHLGYAVQWFGFGAIFLGGLVLLVIRRS